MELSQILEVCDKYICYKGGGRSREPWWQKTVARKQLSATIKDIFEAAWERRWKYGRHGRSGANRDVEESEDGAWSDGYQDSGTETSDAKVGEC